MIELILQGHISLFIIILIAIVISLTFHEFGHAVTAKYYGDSTAQKAGRLTLNPMAHIDPMGLLMVALIGFGYAKPVPTNPNNFNSTWANLVIAAAGPAMNLLIAVVSINFYVFGLANNWNITLGEGAQHFFIYLSLINLIIMIFNMIPIGALDGHYILPYLLPTKLAKTYQYWNQRYGNQLLLCLILLSFFGVPIFSYILTFGQSLLPFITFLG